VKLHIVNITTTKWSTLAKYSSRSIKKGTPTYVYNDGIDFTRDLIRIIDNKPEEMVVLCGRDNHMTNALKIAKQFQQIFPAITQLETVI